MITPVSRDKLTACDWLNGFVRIHSLILIGCASPSLPLSAWPRPSVVHTLADNLLLQCQFSLNLRMMLRHSELKVRLALVNLNYRDKKICECKKSESERNK